MLCCGSELNVLERYFFAAKKYKADILANTGEKVVDLIENPPSFVVSSVARMTEQKFYFFKQKPEALKEILR